MANIKYHYNRRPRNFLLRKVSEALPEFFTQDYPNLVTFLEKYYDYLDSDGASSFDYKLRKIYQSRDTQETSSDLLKFIIEEIAAGNTGGNFIDPNFYAQRIHELHRTKGSRFSIEEFFRAFFQQNVEVEYPKKDIFTLGHDSDGPLSRIGAESNKFIRNNALYQVFSILIKSAISQSTWLELYKKFVHPAGFYIAGQVVTDVEAIGSLTGPLAILDSADRLIEGTATPIVISPFTQLTALYDSADGTTIRARLDEKVSLYQSLTLSQLAGFYSSVEEIITPNSFTFDDDLGTGVGGSNFTYNGYPRAGAGAEDTTYFAADSAGHEEQYFLASNFDPHADLNTLVNAVGASFGFIGVSWNQSLDSSNPIALAASALQGTPTQNSFIYIDSSDPDFDVDNFVNPEHFNEFGPINSTNVSAKLPGLLIKGSVMNPPTPEFYYRVDSDAYYIGTGGFPDGSYTGGQLGNRFKVSKLRWLGNDSAGVPDMSMTFETMDNDQFDSSFNS